MQICYVLVYTDFNADHVLERKMVCLKSAVGKFSGDAQDFHSKIRSKVDLLQILSSPLNTMEKSVQDKKKHAADWKSAPQVNFHMDSEDFFNSIWMRFLCAAANPACVVMVSTNYIEIQMIEIHFVEC